jgi:hypothetical protein
VEDLRDGLELDDRAFTSPSQSLNKPTDAAQAACLDRVAALLRTTLAKWLHLVQAQACSTASSSSSHNGSNTGGHGNYSGSHGSSGSGNGGPSPQKRARHEDRAGCSSNGHAFGGSGNSGGFTSGPPQSREAGRAGAHAGFMSPGSVHSGGGGSLPADRFADPFTLPPPPLSSHGGGGLSSSSSGGQSSSGASLASLAFGTGRDGARGGGHQEVTEMVEVDVAEAACGTGHLEWVRVALVGDSGANLFHVKRETGVAAHLKKSSLGLGASSLHFVLRAKTPEDMARGLVLIHDLVATVTANYHDLVASSSAPSAASSSSSAPAFGATAGGAGYGY